ncbi:MAG: TetR/AcrR family transcriptional regulator [Candidatus Aminicenantaceae bacterium]|jgi:TetR/AcrR family fatty acid metabolism transcriptional regulator
MPKIVDKEEKKTQILEASIRVFAEKGWNKTKISDIAEAADIGKGTVYEYFRSKDEVFAASFRYFMAQAETIVAGRLTPIDDPLERLWAYFSSWADILESEYVDYLEIVIDFWAEGIRSKGRFSSVDLMRVYYDNRTFIEGLLEECIAQDKIKPIDTKIVASIIIGALDGLMLQWIMDRNVFDLKKAVRSTARLIIDGMKKEN